MKTITIERPKICSDEHLQYLDDLRESGVTNMFGAASYLEAGFYELDRAAAKAVLAYWMKTFEVRHPQ